jgi:hypothetical protein
MNPCERQLLAARSTPARRIIFVAFDMAGTYRS